MRVGSLAAGCALLFGACLLPKYRVVEDGGTSGDAGTGSGGASGRGGSSGGSAGRGGAGGAAGSAVAGTAGSIAGGGGVNAAGGMAGAVAGVGGTTTGTGGGGAGHGGTTGTGGVAGGRGGTIGTGGAIGPTGTAGTIGTAGRGGTTGSGGIAGSAAGRGGTTGSAGSGGGSGGTGGTAGGGGSTVSPDWLQSIAVVYKFDLAPDQLGVEAHGNGALHLEEQGTFLPTRDTTTAIQGSSSAKLTGTLQYPTYFQTPPGIGLPSVFQTEPSNSWTTGGWFHITATTNQQWLIHDEGPTDFQQGGFFFYVDQQVGKLSQNTAFALCRVGAVSNSDPALNNLKEVSTQEDSLVGDVGFDPVVPGNWIHLVCRYNAPANELTIFIAGAQRARKVDTTHTARSGPGPFMLGCNEPGYCAFQGNMDEVFWSTSALSDAAINRIYACGIDGSRCRCSGSAYATCGFASVTSCGNLPSCNSTTPP